MTCFADTSLLLSLVGTDAHSPTAKRWWHKLSGPLVTTALVIFDKNQRALAKSAGLKIAP